jgi:molecular chaperone DnaK
MGSNKINFGIDLGTTNSAIAKMEGGNAKIRKNENQMDTTPSCVSFNKRGAVQVGLTAYNTLRRDKLNSMKDFNNAEMNAFIEFKRTMGTDRVYESKNMGRNYNSEELSAEVLKKLKSLYDEEIRAAVITVPAKFTINQNDATARAAKMAGFEHYELLQEPIAAAMAYSLECEEKNGIWVVFDFGGGTFDAAIVKVEDGIMKILDTEGDNYLGGKNIDYAIVDEIIIPYLKENYEIESVLVNDEKKEILRNALKSYAEEAKIELSVKSESNILSELGDIRAEDEAGNEFELDIKITIEYLEKIIGKIYQKAVDLTKELLKRNNISREKINAIILVGGPTFSPIVRNMLNNQIANKINTKIDPMTIVARGAALYASTIDISEEVIALRRDEKKLQISLGHEATTVEEQEWVTIKLLSENNLEGEYYFEFVNGDGSWGSGKAKLSREGEIVEVQLEKNCANAFTVNTYDKSMTKLECEPSEFTIIQGSKVPSAPLPYHIGIEVWDKEKGREIFLPIKGLEKNQSLPATGGVDEILKTTRIMRPGVKDDLIIIPIYQGSNDARGTRAIYNEHVYDIHISAENFEKLLPIESDVEITLYADRSQEMTLTAFFPYLEHSEEIKVPKETQQTKIDANFLETEIEKAEQNVRMIKEEGVFDEGQILKITEELSEMKKLLEQGRSDYDRKKQVLNNLRLTLQEIDRIIDKAEWPKAESDLNEAFYELEDMFSKVKGKVEEIDDDKVTETINEFKERIPQVIKAKEIKIAREMTELIKSITFSLWDLAMGAQMEIQILRDFNNDFGILEWSDKNKARVLINQGLQMASNNPSKQKLRPLVLELYKLLPGVQTPLSGGIGRQGILKIGR